MEKKELRQPEYDVQERMNALMRAKPEEIEFCGKIRKIGWMRPGTQQLYTDIIFEEKDPLKQGTKVAACILLNDVFIWFRRLVYPIYWRWLYYIEDISMAEIVAIQDAAKKKLPQEAYYLNTILTIGMMNTIMTTKTEEASTFQAALNGGQPTL